jgi:hypothetical protein
MLMPPHNLAYRQHKRADRAASADGRNELKPLILGAGGDAILVALIGFTWGGWVTHSSSEMMAAQRSTAPVVAALAPICASQFQTGSDAESQQIEFVKKSSWDQTKLVENSGWAKMPGSPDAQPGVGKACADLIVKLKV